MLLAARAAALPRPARPTIARPATRPAPRRAPRAPRRVAVATFSPGASGLTPELKSALDKFVQQHTVVLFMKGTRDFPQCGFSNTAVTILNALQVPFETCNILEDEALRTGLKEYSQWPTFPQLYVGGEFVGGCDIMIQMFQDGSLAQEVEVALNQ